MNDAAALSPALPTAGIDWSEARDRMVDGQVRPNKVVDPRIIQAMRRLPRERFVPAHLAARAYADDALLLPNGRALIEPMVIARLVQLLRLHDGERGLVVGAGAGYGAALLEACGGTITALEEDAGLLALARAVLPGVAPGVRVVDGPLAAGWPGAAPYDFILVEGAVQDLPAVFAGQLKPLGRLATVLANPAGRSHGAGQGVLAEIVHVGSQTRLRAQPFFDCSTPFLPQFQPKPAFSF